MGGMPIMDPNSNMYYPQQGDMNNYVDPNNVNLNNNMNNMNMGQPNTLGTNNQNPNIVNNK